jgi:membrane-associated phospholipid phosphatase
MTSTLLSAFVPAVGTFAHHVMAPDVLSLLPAGAGRYYLPIFYAYRSGALNTVDIHHFDGVVTFPSFHAAMALMTAYAFRDVRWLFGPICIWSGLTLLATMPIGGHYAVDVVAGAGVWSIFALLHRVTRNGIHLCLHSAYAQRKLRPILQDYLGISMS